MQSLFHVSEDPEIERFEPREPPSQAAGVEGRVVWAVNDSLLQNYLLPRDCPRVTFYPLPHSTERDIKRLIGPSGARHVVAIEAAWFDRAVGQRLWIYELPGQTFEPVDPGAGYFVSRSALDWVSRTPLDSPLEEILRRGVELRVVPSLRPLRDAVVASSLQFSCIRMRNAAARPSE